jgi:hypothetical protein
MVLGLPSHPALARAARSGPPSSSSLSARSSVPASAVHDGSQRTHRWREPDSNQRSRRNKLPPEADTVSAGRNRSERVATSLGRTRSGGKLALPSPKRRTCTATQLSRDNSRPGRSARARSATESAHQSEPDVTSFCNSMSLTRCHRTSRSREGAGGGCYRRERDSTSAGSTGKRHREQGSLMAIRCILCHPDMKATSRAASICSQDPRTLEVQPG